MEIVFCGILAAAWAGEPIVQPKSARQGLIFSASYDGASEKAEFARGKPESVNFTRSLQFMDAMGSGVIKTGFQTLDNEKCHYEMTGNFDPQEGTLSVWVRPDNWRPSDKRSYVFFAAEIPEKYRLLLFKPADETNVALQISIPGDSKATHTVRCPAVHWQPKEWHKLDAVWSAQALKLFVDGEFAADEAKETRPTDGAYRFPSADPKGVFSINPNHYFKDEATSSSADRTTVDEVRICDTANAAGEIRKSYLEAKKLLAGGVYRKPLITIPFSAKPVKTDGKLAAEEWDDAVKVPIQHLTGQAKFSGHFGEAMAKYDHHGLYLGFHARGEKTPVTKIGKRDGYVWEDGAFEVILLSGDSNAPKIQFAINSANVVFDMKNNDPAWNGIQQSGAGLDGDGWSAEVALAFKDIGVEPTGAGARWSGNFMHDWDQRRAGYATWAFASTPGGEGAFLNAAYFGTFVFGAESPTARIQSLGNLLAGKVDANMAISPGKDSADFKANFRLTSEKTAPQEITKSLKAGASARFEAAGSLGKPNLLSITATDSSGVEVLVYDQSFDVKPPIALAYKCWPHLKQLEVELDASNLDDESLQRLGRGDLKGQLSLAVVKGGNALARIEVAPKNVRSTWSLPFPKELPAGKYEVRASFPAPQGGQYEQKKPFEVPPDDFLRAKCGINHEAPETWTPVEVSARSVKVLGREYALGESPFPVKMTSLGRDVLAKPLEWWITTQHGEEKIAWDGLSLKEKFDDEATFEGRGVLKKSGIKASCRATLEFDGQWLATVTLAPESVPVEIKAMRIAYTVPSESSSYALAPLVRPWQKDRVLLDLFDGIQEPPNCHTPMGGFWLTGLKTGLYFFTPTDANWIYQPAKPNVRIVREGGKTDVTILMIHKPVTLQKPASYVLGLTATPTKRQPPRNWNSGEHEWIFQPGTWRDWISLVTTTPGVLRQGVEEKRKKGFRFLYQYSCATIITGDHPYQEYWGPTWFAGNHFAEAKDFAICPNSDGRELVIQQVENLARDFQVAPYFDMSGIVWCDSKTHGCGFIDSFGRESKTTSVLGYRDELKRIYKILHKHGCWAFHHNHSLFVMPAHTFTDLWLPGEQYTTVMAGKMEHFYTQHVPRTDYLVEMNPFIHGVTMVFLPQYGRSADLSGEKDFERWGRDEHAWAAERLLAMLLPHDIAYVGAYVCPKPGEKVAQIYRDHGVFTRLDQRKPAAIFTGYWDKPKITTDDLDVLLSYYTRPDSPDVFAVLSNPTAQEKTVRLKMKSDRHVIRDEYRNEELPRWNSDGIIVPSENFRLLWITPEQRNP